MVRLQPLHVEHAARTASRDMAPLYDVFLGLQRDSRITSLRMLNTSAWHRKDRTKLLIWSFFAATPWQNGDASVWSTKPP
jgi:hypothetical protein